MAQLYENQASYLINEAASTDSSGSFETVVFPIVRRVFSKLLANDLVSVQAMNLPIGKLFYFVPKIQGYTAQVLIEHFAPIGAKMDQLKLQAQAGYGAMIKTFMIDFTKVAEPTLDPAGLFDYSKGSIFRNY
jgi:hypothetical protein